MRANKHQPLHDEVEDDQQIMEDDAAGAEPHARRSTGVILYPDEDFKVSWDFAMMALILFSALSVPFRLAFDAEAVGTMWLLEVAVSLCFVVDLIINFNVAFQPPGSDEWVVERTAIAREYCCKGTFVIDAPSSVPVELIELCFAADTGNSSSLRVLRVLRLFRLFRLLKLLKLETYMARIEEELDVNMRPFRVVILIVKLLFCAHLFGCGWKGVSSLGDNGGDADLDDDDEGGAFGSGTWLSTAPFEATETADQYLLAFNWALSALTGTSALVKPVSSAEVWYSTAGCIVGALSFGYIIGEIGSLLAALDKQSAMVEEKIDSVREYLRWRQVPRPMGLAVRRYYNHYYQTRSVFDEKSILGELNPELHTQLVGFILERSIGRLPLFASLRASFQTAIFPFLKPMFHKPGEVVFERGAESGNLCFLLEGLVRVLNCVDEAITTHQLRSGSKVGQHIVFLDVDGSEIATRPWTGCFGQSVLMGTRRAATHVAEDSCEILSIDKADVLAIFSAEPKDASTLFSKVLKGEAAERARRNLMTRLSYTALPAGSAERAALVIQLCVRRWVDLKTVQEDEIHRLIEQHSRAPSARKKKKQVRIDGAVLHLRAASRIASRVASRAASRAGSRKVSPVASHNATPPASRRPPSPKPPSEDDGHEAATQQPPPQPPPPHELPAAWPPLPAPLGQADDDEQADLASAVASLSAAVQDINARMVEHEAAVMSKLETLARLMMDEKVNGTFGKAVAS